MAHVPRITHSKLSAQIPRIHLWPQTWPTTILIILFLSLAACGGNTNGSVSSTNVRVGGTLKIGLNSDVTNLDPLKSTSLYDRMIILNVYDTLVTLDEQNTIKPMLATSWTYSTPTDLIMTLRSDVKFQDGTLFDSSAVVTNIQRLLTTSSSPRYSEINTIDTVKSIDPTHVEFTLKKPFAPLLSTFTDRAGVMVSPKVLQSNASILANAPVNAGSGPFIFSEAVKGDHITLKKNPNYWQKDSAGRSLPYLDQVRYSIITNESTMYAQLTTDTIQIAEALNATDIPSVKANSSLTYRDTPGLGFNGFELNTRVAPLNNVHVRRAIAYGTNRNEILKLINQNLGVTSHGPISPTSFAYGKDNVAISFDQSAARNELTMANLASPPEFTFLVASDSPVNAQFAQLVQSELAQVNIKVDIKFETFSAILDDTTNGNFQAAAVSWSGRVDPDGNMYSWFHTGGGNNNMGYSNPSVDRLLEDARANSDQNTRITDYQEAEKTIVGEAPYIFTTHGLSIQATTTKVKNFLLLPNTIILLHSVYLSA
jgi:peptide/nickel transport system substrate-binding protein